MSLKIPVEVLKYGEFDWKGDFKITKPMPENIKKIYENYQKFLEEYLNSGDPIEY